MEREMAESIINYLVGTNSDYTPEKVVEELKLNDTLTPGDLEYIDSQIFRCSECGFWDTTDELQNNNQGEKACSDCSYSEQQHIDEEEYYEYLNEEEE
jgi:hypothetical protein